MTRRNFLGGIGAVATTAAVLPIDACRHEDPDFRWAWKGDESWTKLREQFSLDPSYIHMAGLLVTSHPRPVTLAIERYRTSLDKDPAQFLEEHNGSFEGDVREAAAKYLGVRAADIALTDSTTMGIALVYNGVTVRPDQELLTTTNDYFVTHESLRYKANRTGATLRIIEPFARSSQATEEEMVHRIISEIRPNTRVLALTWVHSWTGVKIPVRHIANELNTINATRDFADRVLLCLDGVHGLGVEEIDLDDLGCDFFMAGTHKWLFGARGTGIFWGRPEVQDEVGQTIPTFSETSTWGGRMTPGGFKAFEHRWATAQAFDLHRKVGKQQIAERIHALNTQCKEGIRNMQHVQLYTPLDPNLSAGIVCFDVEGMSPQTVVRRLAEKRIVASVTPYNPPHARLSPGLLNNPAEVEVTLEAIRALK